jgi:putative PIN family toxin of toxin-antitoxin system
VRIVLDTNVLVAGLLTPFGTCGEIVRMITSGDLTLCVDARTLFEYEEVIHQTRFYIDPSRGDIVLNYIRHTCESSPSSPLPSPLPDPDDGPFLEIAMAANAECLVTGNPKHIPVNCRGSIQVLSPGEFLDLYRKRGKTG